MWVIFYKDSSWNCMVDGEVAKALAQVTQGRAIFCKGEV